MDSGPPQIDVWLYPNGTVKSDIFEATWEVTAQTFITIYGDNIWYDAPNYIFFTEFICTILPEELSRY